MHTCRDLSQFWQFIKREFSTYQERREFLWNEFEPLLTDLESYPQAVLQMTDAQLLTRLSQDAVQAVWQRALERRNADPEGAITSARTLLETVCKHILDDLSIAYDDTADLPKLYRLASDALNIAPSQHSEPVFKQILGGCTAVVEGLGALRNRLGDAAWWRYKARATLASPRGASGQPRGVNDFISHCHMGGKERQRCQPGGILRLCRRYGYSPEFHAQHRHLLVPPLCELSVMSGMINQCLSF